MRRWLFLLAIVFVVLAGAVVLAVLNLDSYVNRNREAVAKRVQTALGREVAFGEVGISFAGGLGVRVSDLSVGDDPAFSQEDFLRVETVDVQVALLPALFGRIEVSRVVLRSPRVTLIQTKRGLSTDSLGGGGGGGGPPQEGATGSPALLVSLLNVQDGELRYEDRTAQPPVALSVTRLDVDASEISMSRPVDFELRAALFGADGQNLRVSGRVGPLDAPVPRADAELRLDPLALDAALQLKAVRELLPPELAASGSMRVEARVEGTADALSFDASLDAGQARLRYGEAFEKAAGTPATLELRGSRKGRTVEIASADLRIGDTKLHAKATLAGSDPQRIDFQADAAELRPAAVGAMGPDDVIRRPVLEGSLTLPASGPRGRTTLRSPSGSLSGGEYRNLALDVALANQRITIEKLAADAFEGRLSATGRYDMSQKTPRFSLEAELAEMQAEPLLGAGGESQAPLTGTLGAQLSLAGAGSGWEEMKPRLGGDGSLRIVDGVLRQFNPAGSTLLALADLPLTSGRLREVIEAHPRAFGMEDAPYRLLEARYEIREGWLELRQLLLEAEEYELTGGGRYSLDGKADLKTQLLFSRELSDELLAAEPYLRYARTADGRVQIPVALSGTSPKFAVLPDVSRLGQTAARQALAEKLLEAAGGSVPGASPGAEAGQAGEPAPAPTAEDLGREALRRGIQGLLGGQRQQGDPAD